MSKKKITLEGLKQKFCANAKDLGRCFDKLISDEHVIALLEQSPIIHREFSAMNVYIDYFLMMKNTLVEEDKTLEKYRTTAFEAKPKEGQPDYQFLIDVFCDLCHSTSTIGIGLVGRMANEMAMNQAGTVKFYDFPGHATFKGHELRAVVAAEVARLNEMNADKDAIIANADKGEELAIGGKKIPEFKPDIIVDIVAKFSKNFTDDEAKTDKIRASIWEQLDVKGVASFKDLNRGKQIGLRFFAEEETPALKTIRSLEEISFASVGMTQSVFHPMANFGKTKGTYTIAVSDNAPIKKSLEAKISKLNQSN